MTSLPDECRVHPRRDLHVHEGDSMTIPHNGPDRGRTVRDSASMIRVALLSLGVVPVIGFTPKPKLGRYQECEQPRRPAGVAPLDVPRRERGGRRVDPVAELRRLKRSP